VAVFYCNNDTALICQLVIPKEDLTTLNDLVLMSKGEGESRRRAPKKYLIYTKGGG